MASAKMCESIRLDTMGLSGSANGSDSFLNISFNNTMNSLSFL